MLGPFSVKSSGVALSSTHTSQPIWASHEAFMAAAITVTAALSGELGVNTPK